MQREYEHLLVEREGHVAVVRLNRPQALNALNAALMTELADALEVIDDDDEIRCTVLAGDERAFASSR